MQVPLFFLVVLVSSALCEAPSSSYGAPFRQPQPAPRPSAAGSRATPVKTAAPAVPAVTPSNAYEPAVAPAAPYPAAGWRPLGRQFFLPARQTAYYSIPSEYGPPPPPAPTTPEPTTTEAATTTEVPTTTESADLGFAGGRNAALRDVDESGVYYILQPDGRLQRVAYAHGPAPAQLSARSEQVVTPGYLARFQYQDLQPAGAPIYTYGQPELVRIK